MPYVDRQGRICGFLDIEDTENSGKFLRRYFILDSKANGLYWFMDNPQNLPDGASHVGHLELAYVNKVSDATKIRPKAEFCFVINSGMQRYFLQANDQQDLTDWVDALNNASKITVPRPESNNDPGDCLHSKTNSSCQPPQSCAYRTQIVGGVAMQVPVSPEDAASEVVPAEAAQNVLLYCLQNNSPQLDAQAAHGPGQPIKTGYCVKQGGMMKNWKQRYFVLSENAISYYKSDCERDPQRTISLRDVRSAREFDLSVRTSELLRRDNLFEIVTPNRTFFVQAPSPEEMHSWIKAISAAIVAQRGPARSTASEVPAPLGSFLVSQYDGNNGMCNDRPGSSGRSGRRRDGGASALNRSRPRSDFWQPIASSAQAHAGQAGSLRIGSAQLCRFRFWEFLPFFLADLLKPCQVG
uniref:pleckstrin homology domain-containing family A member 1-like isoform X3 n=1 Tax=Myxine glutinosa TaxID=7769 RepID=UPI00358E7EE4